MIERIDQQVSARQTAPTTATTATQQPTEAATQTPAASGIKLTHPTDRVEISEQGYASVSATSADEDTARAVTEAVAQATAQSEGSTTNLTSLSEDQLENLVTDGSISRAQADSELARRQGGVEA